MSLTTEVRIHWPVSPTALLDHVTKVAGGDPATIERMDSLYDWPGKGPDHELWNAPDQGLSTWAAVAWSIDGPVRNDSDDERVHPPALLVLRLDNVGPDQVQLQAEVLLPAVAEWLDAQGVPRDHWWWEDEGMGTWHPGTTDVRLLDSRERHLRQTWTP